MSSFHLRLDLPKDFLFSDFSMKFLCTAETIFPRYMLYHLIIFDSITFITPGKEYK
jgi:hypothetical protein